MRRGEPTLRVDFATKANPACSICGMPFGSEGMARSLMDAFALHVRRQHLSADENSTIRTKSRETAHSVRRSENLANRLRRLARTRNRSRV
jgi:hypothetical protein